MEKAEASQKFSIDYNSQAPSSHQVVRRKNYVIGDNRETRFHYAPSHHRFKQFPPSFQPMAQEQAANQQQLQQRSRSNRYHTITQGRIQDSQKGGAQIQCSEYDNCVRSTQSGMQSMPNLGGSGGMPPPENFEKLDPLRLNLRAFLIVCYFFY